VLLLSVNATISSVAEGGQVVIRTTCNGTETTLRPYEILSNGDLVETAIRNKSESVAADSSVTVGSNLSETIGLNLTSALIC